MFIFRRGVSFQIPHIFNIAELLRLFWFKFTNFRIHAPMLMTTLLFEQFFIMALPDLPHYAPEVKIVTIMERTRKGGYNFSRVATSFPLYLHD